MLDIVLISGEDVCCGVVFVTQVGVSVFSVVWSELLMIYVLVVIFLTFLCSLNKHT